MAVEREDVWEDARDTRLQTTAAIGATSLTVVSGGVGTWGPVVYGKFSVVLDRGTIQEEHVYATGISGDQITGVTPLTQAHDAGSCTVHHGLRASHVAEPNEFLSMPTAAGQFAQSTAAGTWGATATPDITDFTDAQHSHGSAAEGGALDLTTLVLPLSSAPAQTADGSAVWDSDDNLLTVGTGVGRKTMADTDSTQTLTNKTIQGGSTWNDGTVNLDGGVLVLPLAATPSQTTEGAPVWDNDSDLLTVGDGAGRKTMVDTTSAQTLTGPKTLTAPVIGDFTAAQHDHGDADDGGALVVAALPASVPLGTVVVDDTFSSQTSTGSESAALLSGTFTAAAGRRYRATVAGVRLRTDTADDTAEVRIKNGGTIVQATPLQMTAAGGAGAGDATCIGYVIGAGASVTLEAVVIRTGGTGTVTAEAGNGVPSLVIDDIGV